MNRYKLKSGSHVDENGKTYSPGDTVVSDSDLTKAFPNKFELVGPSKPLSSLPPAKRAAALVEDPDEEEDEDDEEEEEEDEDEEEAATPARRTVTSTAHRKPAGSRR